MSPGYSTGQALSNGTKFAVIYKLLVYKNALSFSSTRNFGAFAKFMIFYKKQQNNPHGTIFDDGNK